MALQINTEINGIQKEWYVAIVNSRTQKIYQQNDAGESKGVFLTWIYINVFANNLARLNNQKNLKDCIVQAEGDLTLAQQYDFLKTQNIQMLGLNLTQAIDV